MPKSLKLVSAALLLTLSIVFIPGVISKTGFPKIYPDKQRCIGSTEYYFDINNVTWTKCYGYLNTGSVRTVLGEFGLPYKHPISARCLGLKYISDDKDIPIISCYGFLYDPWLE